MLFRGAMSLVQSGSVLAGKYRLVRRLGRGTMGEVWLGMHGTLGEEVAVKILSAGTGGPDESPAAAAARFAFEAKICARISRKTRHVVRVTDHGDHDGLPYLVMERLEGETLDERLARGGPLAPADLADVLVQLGRALDCVHAEGVVHRDVKPPHVFLARDEDTRRLVKLLDFGIARVACPMCAPTAFATGSGLVCGTPGYMSPEQACAMGLDRRWDLWALATVAYESLTGELPVPGSDADEVLGNLVHGRMIPVHERDPDLPRGLGAFFARAFAPEVEQRFASARELAEAFTRALEPAPPPRAEAPKARPSRGTPSAPGRWRSWVSRRALARVSLTGALLTASTQTAGEPPVPPPRARATLDEPTPSTRGPAPSNPVVALPPASAPPALPAPPAPAVLPRPETVDRSATL